MVSIASRTWRAARRLLGYFRSDEDLRAVYGEHPNGPRDEGNVAGNVASNLSGGVR